MGIRPSKLFWSPVEKPLTMVPEMMQRANHYITTETLIVDKCEKQKRPRTEQSRGPTSRPSRWRLEGSNFNRSRPSTTPLNSTRTERHLGHYIQKQRDNPDWRPKSDQRPRTAEPIGRQIDVIVSGPTARGDSSSTRKAYVRAAVEKKPKCHLDPEISFQPEGEEYPDHDDAMVITICIANARKLGLTNQDFNPTDIYNDMV
ncbi:hypothetical protein BHM03_00046881 [Ensete ventricosum]|nr:hypothetical protein BHM03_00046881 [Ensete ventricosum]